MRIGPSVLSKITLARIKNATSVSFVLAYLRHTTEKSMHKATYFFKRSASRTFL